MNEEKTIERLPGVCVPWEEKSQEMGEIHGDEQQVRQSWEEVDSFGYTFIWQVLLSF